MTRNVEHFFSFKLNKLSQRFDTEEIVSYKGYYSSVSNEKLTNIFALLHSRLNHLFTFINHKNNGNKHYNADQSRELIELDRQINLIQTAIKNDYTEFSFDIDSYYKQVLDKCKQFLSSTGGSEIPEDFTEIEIIDYKPIFELLNSITFQGSEKLLTVNKQLIGSGSYADVYKYKDPHYNCYFATKKANMDIRSDELERFTNEYSDLKNLDSPFIIKVYHYDKKSNEYTMELADCTLKKFINRYNGKISFNERRALVIQLLNAFEYIHSKNILHRDISFQNILVKIYDDNSYWLKVSDFGLVKRPKSNLTRKGTEVKGAINDFSDLNAVGFENYNIKHETYALALVIYFILTGRSSKYHREKNNELKNFVLKAISDKDNRFTNVQQMRNGLLNTVFPSMKNEQTVLNS